MFIGKNIDTTFPERVRYLQSSTRRVTRYATFCAERLAVACSNERFKHWMDESKLVNVFSHVNTRDLTRFRSFGSSFGRSKEKRERKKERKIRCICAGNLRSRAETWTRIKICLKSWWTVLTTGWRNEKEDKGLCHPWKLINFSISRKLARNGMARQRWKF